MIKTIKQFVMTMKYKDMYITDIHFKHLRDFKISISELERELDQIENKEEKIVFLELAKKMIFNSITYSVYAEYLLKREDNIWQFSILPSSVIIDGKEISLETDEFKKVRFEDCNVYSKAWDKISLRTLSQQIKDVFIDDGSKDNRYWESLNLVYVYEGKNSAAIEKTKDCKGDVKVRIMRDDILLDNIYTDGIHWYNTYDNTINMNVFDYRIAVVFTIQQLIRNIKSQ
ncbi:MAG: DUF6710 family protein [Erysipelotrichaceae bacterium]